MKDVLFGAADFLLVLVMNNNQEAIFLKTGSIAAVAMAALSLADIVISMASQAALSRHGTAALDVLLQFQACPLLTLYSLDFLNLISALVMIPLALALVWVMRSRLPVLTWSGLALFLVGTAAFVSSNPSLPMAELARRLALAGAEQRQILAAAGEALLARGAHGSFGSLPGFLLPTIGNILFSLAQLKSGFFSIKTGWIGLAGHSLLAAYLLALSVTPGARQLIMLVAAPGGILVMVWLGLTARSLAVLAHKTGQ